MRSPDVWQISKSSNHKVLLSLGGNVQNPQGISERVHVCFSKKHNWLSSLIPALGGQLSQMSATVFIPLIARHQHIKCIIHLKEKNHCFRNSGQPVQTGSHRCMCSIWLILLSRQTLQSVQTTVLPRSFQASCTDISYCSSVLLPPTLLIYNDKINPQKT